MSVNRAVQLFQKLIEAFNREKEALEKKDMELLEETGLTVERIMKSLKEFPHAREDEEVAALAAEASLLRNENVRLMDNLMEETRRELGNIRRGKQVHRAYSPESQQGEIFVRKDC